MSNRDPAAVRDAADEILRGPEFTRAGDSLLRDIARAVLDPVGTLQRLFDWVGSQFTVGQGGASWVAWTVVLLAVLLIVFVVVRITQTTSIDKQRDVKLAPDTGTVSAEELLRQAVEEERRGEWRAAIRLRYAAMVAAADQRGVLQRRPGRTTGEYLRQVQQNDPEVAPAFGAATAIFEEVWYGDRDADASVAEQFANTAAATGLQAVAS